MVAQVHQLATRSETVAAHVQRLQAEARSLAQSNVNDVMANAHDLRGWLKEIEAGGEVYPAGVRQEARRLGAEITCSLQSMAAILERRP